MLLFFWLVNDEVSMLSDTHPQSFDEDSQFERFSRTQSAILMNSKESFSSEPNLVGHTGPLRSQRTPFIPMSGPLFVNRQPNNILRPNHSVARKREAESTTEKFPATNVTIQNDWPDYSFAGKNKHFLRSGQLGTCNDLYCATCPTHYNFKGTARRHSKASRVFDTQFHNALCGDAKGWAKRFFSFMRPYIPGVMNPHATVVQHWNKFFIISCLVAIFVDPLFFILTSVQEDNKCIVTDRPLTTEIVVFRSVIDFIYLLHMLLQFRLAYVAPESRVIGAGELVDHPEKIALNYLRGYFLIDLFIVLPLPQIMILLVLPKSLGSSGENYAKNLLRAAVLGQYTPKLYRFLPLFIGQTPSGFILSQVRLQAVVLLTFVLSGHVVGSCWYHFGLQRIHQCLRNACHDSGIKKCMNFLDCGYGDDTDRFKQVEAWDIWKNNANASSCFNKEGGFPYGIYGEAVKLTTEKNAVTRYVYSLFWGFQQISTLAGNQVPSYFVWEVLFTMGIIGLGLLLFAILIGHMQNFLQALGRRRLEMSLRHRDLEQWMSHRRLPEELRRQVRDAEQYIWAATRGVNEEALMVNLPEDLQRDIRRHLFMFIKKVRIFSLMDEPILDAICERLRQKTYIKGSKILYHGGLVEKMVFIVRGKMESIGEDGIIVPLSEGDVCGEELLSWCLEHSSVNKDGKKIRIPGQRLLSNRTVRCFTNVEVFSLRAADIEEVMGTSARHSMLSELMYEGALRIIGKDQLARMMIDSLLDCV
ncbi:hypothetical protein FNV43_RR21112 [Rhamnella rubrinervis]|uniref:Cyclic nucleotide-binding domain-containing protein n=1 Tax=Rhamnella rubrinervis TaxID=2594499 RepID=A0A8K0DW27_9ROSA|nr:hypothetical protein FNV43_RR21112 [Rhamnella rubrinervis]